MHITVDRERCQGHGNCAMRAPQLFRLDEEDGRSTAISDEVPRGEADLARAAADSCPERAIVLLQVDKSA